MAMRGLRGPQKKKKKSRRNQDAARFRTTKVRIDEVDYKDVPTLQRLISAQGKLFSRKRSGLDAEVQRKVSLALKRARFMALMPYVT
jgi:small subunit ribosomal protein S18